MVKSVSQAVAEESSGDRHLLGFEGPPAPVLFALASVASVFAVRLALDPLLGDRSPLILFTVAVALTAWRCGFGPGLLALATSTALGVFFFVEPRTSFAVAFPEEALNLAAFWTANAAVLFVTYRLAEGRTRQALVAADLRRREVEVTRSRDLLHAVVDGSPDPIYVKDRNGAFVLVNERTARIFGTTPRTLVGRRDADYLPQQVAAAVEAMDRDVMNGGQAHLREEVVPEDGELRTYFSSKVPWRSGTGEVLGLIGISRDITDRKRAEGELASSEAQLRAFFDASVAGLVQIDPRTRRFVKVNKAVCDLTGYGAEELLELTLDDLTHPDDRGRDDGLLAPI
ncbi:PAS domain S-box protein, partial [Aureimonas sp. Leaf454]|uniref:PAS domain S-box protein n=1 Tax=Aureimonas sp. Leaf454 TaxID=1736381 RepID=UPI000ABC5AE2